MQNQTKRRVYVEATPLKRLQKTGVDYLTEGLIGELVRLSPDTEFVFFSFEQKQNTLRIHGDNIRDIQIIRMSRRVFRMLLLFGVAPSVEWLTGEKEIQDIIFPDFSAWPVKTKGARIYPYVYDTSYLDTPEYSSPRLQRFLHWTVGRSTRVAKRILVCSESTKRDVMKHYSIESGRVEVLYPGRPAKVKSSKIQLPKRYILFVGTLEPRKNVANLIRAFSMLPESIQQKYPLLLAGKKGWLDEEIQDLILANAKKGVRSMGYVDEATRQALYEHASIFVYPSMYEGFGMPVIEAQMHGVPVITTRSSSMPEAGGKAAEYSKPDARSLAQSIELLLGDNRRRAELAQLGKQHASSFTWERSARKLQKILGIK